MLFNYIFATHDNIMYMENTNNSAKFILVDWGQS